MALDPSLDLSDPDDRAKALAQLRAARAKKVYTLPPAVPEIAKAYQQDPQTRLALTALANGTSTAPVAAGKYGIAEGIARALTGVAGSYIDKGQQQKYGPEEDDYIDTQKLKIKGEMQAKAKAEAALQAANTTPVADTPAPLPTQASAPAQPPAPPPVAPPAVPPPGPPPAVPPPGPPPGGAPMNINPAVANAAGGVLNGTGGLPPPGPVSTAGLPMAAIPNPVQGGGPRGSGPFAQAPAPDTNTVAGRLAAARATLQAQGLKVTSGYRTPQHNAAVGGVSNSYHQSGTPDAPLANDFTPAPGQTMAQASAAAQAAAPGFKVINEGNHIHVQPPSSTPHTGAATLASGVANRAAVDPLAAPTPEDVPALPTPMSRPEAPKPVAAKKSELLNAAYQTILDGNRYQTAQAQEMYTSGLSEQDKMNEAAAEREQDINKMGYQNQLSMFAHSQGLSEEDAYRLRDSVISGNRADNDAFTKWKRDQEDARIKQQGEERIQGMKEKAAAAKADLGDLTQDPETLAFMAQQALRGDRSVFTGLGRGGQGAKNVIALRKEMYKQAAALGIPATSVGARIADLNAQYQGEQREAQQTGQRVGNTNVAAQDVLALAQGAKDAHKAVPTTSFVPLNKAYQMWMNNTSSPELSAAVVANKAIVNAYARSFGNQAASVHAQNEAEHNLAMAWGTKGYDAAVDKIVETTQKEKAAARQALTNIGDSSAAPAAPAAAPDQMTDAQILAKYKKK